MGSNDQIDLEVNVMTKRNAASVSDVNLTGDSAAALAGKAAERKRIQDDIDAFLAKGGTIDSVGKNVVADPPKKPEASYGSQPI